jgi:ATP-dependent Clp protease ATP-binding subunit ClpA
MQFDANLLYDPCFRTLADRRCTTKAIDVLLRVFRQASKEHRLVDLSLAQILTLQTVLRTEINLAQAALEGLRVDMPGLERRLKNLLDQRDQVASPPPELAEEKSARRRHQSSEAVWELVLRAEQEAASMANDWVGTEHLLLAIVRDADPAVTGVLVASGVDCHNSLLAVTKGLLA